MTSVAIIGAGLAGVTLANTLNSAFDISMFEKSSNVGGRMAARNADSFTFDHGAQYFKANSPAFKASVEAWLSEGIITPWNAKFVEIDDGIITKRTQWDADHAHYVGVPNNRSIVEHLSKKLPIQFDCKIASIQKTNAQWRLTAENGDDLGLYDWLVCTMPVNQTQALLASADLAYSQLSNIQMQACFALMLGFDQALSLDFDAAMVKDEIISWVSNNSSKPMRGQGFSILINSTNDWADLHLAKSDDWVIAKLIDRVSNIIQQNLSDARYIELKRWHFANCKRQTNQAYLLDLNNKIGVCGDWFISGRVESAFLSANSLSNAILEQVHG